ncbi:MAG: outer membrane beta-barrel protein, partial [Acidobacteriaceae bacterium]
MKRFPHFPVFLPLLAVLFFTAPAALSQAQPAGDDAQQLRQMVLDLERRVSALEQENRALQPHSPSADDGGGPRSAAALVAATDELRTPGAQADSGSSSAMAMQAVSTSPAPAPPSPLPGTLPGGATLNATFDGYYEYNFNSPAGRANDLRAYDVLSNTFSINQADFIFDLDPDVAAHRSYGFRMDLQFGQATSTLQGNPGSENRPDVYRNIFQVYGTYIVPV